MGDGDVESLETEGLGAFHRCLQVLGGDVESQVLGIEVEQVEGQVVYQGRLRFVHGGPYEPHYHGVAGDFPFVHGRILSFEWAS